MSQRIFVTGFGIITSIGKNADANFQSLINGKSGIGDIELLNSIHAGKIPVCEIKFTHQQLCDLAGVSVHDPFTRTSLLGLIAAKEATQSFSKDENKNVRTGFISSTTVGGIREFELYFNELTDLLKQSDSLMYCDTANPGEHTELIADSLGIHHYIGTVSTACSSSANAIILGAQLLKQNKLDRVICGGADALSKFTINGFNSLMILSKEPCKPFDENRTGLNLGEGAAYIVLESEKFISSSHKKIYAELKGYANTNDAFHQTASSPEGNGAVAAMKQTIASSRINLNDVDYINAHGTATENNDLSEGTAIQKLFSDRIPLFSSTKSYTGHTLAAAGSIEAVYSILALQNKVVYPNLNFKTQMKELNIAPVQTLQRNVQLKNILSNSFGFGGNNTSLLFSSF